MASDVVEYIYDFGVPKSYFHCRYAIYYVDPINRIYEYFTLEKTKNDKIDTYIICGKKKIKDIKIIQKNVKITLILLKVWSKILLKHNLKIIKKVIDNQ